MELLDVNYSLGQKSPYSELFSSVFSRIRTEYEEILLISPYSVRIRESTDQNNSEYGHFLRSGCQKNSIINVWQGIKYPIWYILKLSFRMIRCQSVQSKPINHMFISELWDK